MLTKQMHFGHIVQGLKGYMHFSDVIDIFFLK